MGLTFIFRDPPDYDRAVEEFNRSLSVDPKHPQTLQNLIVAYTRKNDAAKATETLEKLKEVAPGNEALTRLQEEIDKIGG